MCSSDLGIDVLAQHLVHFGADILAIQHLSALTIDNLALLVHPVVVLQHVLADLEVAAFQLFLGAFQRVGDHAVLDGSCLLYTSAYLLGKHNYLKVNVHNPDFKVIVEIRDYGAYIHGPKVPGEGGLPVGTSAGRFLLQKKKDIFNAYPIVFSSPP